MKYIDNVHASPWQPMQVVMGRMVTESASPLNRISELESMGLEGRNAAKLVVAASYVTTAIRNMIEGKVTAK